MRLGKNRGASPSRAVRCSDPALRIQRDAPGVVKQRTQWNRSDVIGDADIPQRGALCAQRDYFRPAGPQRRNMRSDLLPRLDHFRPVVVPVIDTREDVRVEVR